jgi:2-polyprenyl-3-methyl-5-hydroxy-6-metoxy-1,4-benzoquinol methylase
MFGKEFYKDPGILLDSFSEMNNKYQAISRKQKKTSLKSRLQVYYVRLFGIPEIGFQIRFLYFQKLIGSLKQKPKKILDAGSGIGSQVFWLTDRYKSAEIIGVDIDKNKLKSAQEFKVKFFKSKNISFSYGDVTAKVKQGNKHDLIVNIDVLEHVKDYKVALRNFYLLLKKGGYLYIHTPQPNQKRIFKQFKSWEHEDHVREGYTPELLLNELERCGFKIIDSKETFGYFGKLAWELNHFSLAKSFILAGMLFPFLFMLAKLDVLFSNKNGLGTAILAEKL